MSQMIHTKFGYICRVEAQIDGELERELKMSKHIKHTKSHKKSKIKARKRKALQARKLNELKLRNKADNIA